MNKKTYILLSRRNHNKLVQQYDIMVTQGNEEFHESSVVDSVVWTAKRYSNINIFYNVVSELKSHRCE